MSDGAPSTAGPGPGIGPGPAMVVAHAALRAATSDDPMRPDGTLPRAVRAAGPPVCAIQAALPDWTRMSARPRPRAP
jgi:hypothetical protein